MIVLLLTSLVGLAFIIERGVALRWKKIIPPLVATSVENCASPADIPMLRKVCEQTPSPLSTVVLTAISHLDWPKAENTDAVQTKARKEITSMERGLVVLEIIVGIAPLLGLVGTIGGLITLFRGLGLGGNTVDNSIVAAGIAEALNTTLMGLLIAIPSLIFWSYLTKKVERQIVEMETLCDEFLRRIYRQKGAQ